MAQGTAGFNVLSNQISFADTASVDSFSRLRVANPTFLFDAQHTYDLNPLLFEQVTSGSGASIAHDATNRCATMTFSATPTGGKSYMQSFEWIPYQPGRCNLFLITFNFLAAAANCLKWAGIGDNASNGIFFEQSGSTKQFSIYSGTSQGNQTATQTNWNLDRLDGTGPSGLTLDTTKTNILIGFQALYVGRVRVGFDIGGTIIFVHQFNHANIVSYPYIQIASLPISVGMSCTGTVSTTMNFICCSAISEGGAEEPVGYQFTQEGSGTAGNNARAHIMSIRPKTTFNGIVNRMTPVIQSVELLVTGNQAVFWELVVGQAITGTTTYTDVNTSYSSMEYNTAGTISGSPAIVIASGYVASSTNTKGSGLENIRHRLPITLSAAGAVRALGTVSLIATAVGAASTCRATISWTERR